MEYFFEWDPRKASANIRRHGVRVEQATTVFQDPRAISIYDSQHSSAEDRWMTLGLSASGGLVVVHHTFEELGKRSVQVRIVSSRKATRREVAQYNG